MTPLDIAQHIVPGALWVAGLAFVGFVAAVVVGAVLTQGKRLPGALAALPIVATVLVSMVVSAAYLSAASAGSFDERLPALAAALGARFILLLSGPAVGLTLLGFGAFVAARREPRSWRTAAALGAAACLVAAVPATYAWVNDDWVHPSVRIAAHLFLAAGVTVAGLGAEARDEGRPEALALVGVAFAWSVAAVESSVLAMARIMLVRLAPLTADQSGAYLDEVSHDVMAVLDGWALVTVAVAVLVGIVCQIPTMRTERRGEGSAGVVLCVAALVAVVAGWPSLDLLTDLLEHR